MNGEQPPRAVKVFLGRGRGVRQTGGEGGNFGGVSTWGREPSGDGGVGGDEGEERTSM